MAMPPLFPLIDWKTVFDSGKTFDQWLGGGDEGRSATMAMGLEEQGLEAPLQHLLGSIKKPVHVVAIAEDWCGDVVRHVPVLERLAQASPQIHTRYISREQHKDIFVRYLTNGGEAIPKFIFLSDNFVECGNWGPMTEVCRRIIARGKACGDGAGARQKVGQLYAADANKFEVARELAVLINLAAAETP